MYRTSSLSYGLQIIRMQSQIMNGFICLFLVDCFVNILDFCFKPHFFNRNDDDDYEDERIYIQSKDEASMDLLIERCKNVKYCLADNLLLFERCVLQHQLIILNDIFE